MERLLNEMGKDIGVRWEGRREMVDFEMCNVGDVYKLSKWR